MSRVQGVIRRTPSPQQVFDTVSKKTAAGWAAAGAALASIREEDKDDAYGDHSRWSEEAAIRRSIDAQSAQSTAAAADHTRAFAAAKRKTVVLVVSAESLTGAHDDDGSYRSENATILSHLPDTDFAKTRLFVLIYSSTLRSRPASPLGSSYSAISTPARTPAEELASIDPQPDHHVYTPALSARSSDTLLWSTLHSQALRLVEHPAMAMPFSTPSGFVHMLRHLSPDLVYVVDALSGPDGTNIADLKRWVGQTVVVVGSDGTALGGLVDTDDEESRRHPKPSEHHVSKWWESADMVGLGKGVDVVDASRFEDDYERRAGGRE
ncbi:peroxin 22-like protein [Stagonosporopsis vannaccii]|nr:peroxin 22-like protein [Stagonosporopsis vannaccii]